MAKLAAKKKPTKPDAPKKPSSRSKTGNAECSQAASNWQLSIRGKATLNPGTYQTLAKCRAMNRTGKMAEAQGRTGKLSDQGAAALKGRLQKRFDSGLITQKSRNERLNMLLKQRSERGKSAAKSEANLDAEQEARNLIYDTNNAYLAKRRKYIQDSVEAHNKHVRPDSENSDYQKPMKISDWDEPRLPKHLGAKQAISYIEESWPEYKSVLGGTQASIRKALETGSFKTGIREFGVEYSSRASSSGVGRLPIRYTTWNREEIDRAAAAAIVKQRAGKTTSSATNSASAPKTAPKPEPAKPAFSLKSDSRPAGMTSKNQGSFFQSETDIERAVRIENASKPKPLAGQGDMFDVTTQRLAPTASAARVLTPAKGVPLKSAVKAVKGKLLERAATQSGVATLRTDLIQADPQRFQYKMNTAGPIGVTDQFKETTTWNRELAGVVQVWKDPSNKQTYIVNGHHRFELAQRLGVKRLNVQYIQAKDASEARSKGALTNIAEGRGTSIDAARFFREQTDVKDWTAELKGRGISLSERTAREGLALKDVAPKIWRDVVDEMTPVSRAVAIGQSKLREEDQLKLYRKASEGNWTAGKTAEFGTELKRAPLVKSGEASLFGDDNFVNTAEHRAALADKFKTSLKSGKKLFGTVSRSRNAGRLEAAGNQIDRETSAAIAQANDKALMAFDIERKYGSRTSRLLDRYAAQIGQGDKLERVYGGFEARVTRALQRDIEKPFEARLAKRRARLASLSR